MKICVLLCFLLVGCVKCEFIATPGLVVKFIPPCEEISANIRDGEYTEELKHSVSMYDACELTGAFDRSGTYILTTNRGEVTTVVVTASNDCQVENITIVQTTK